MAEWPVDVLVLGAGVSGLTVALCAARIDKSVRVLSDRDPLATTSAAAGAVWGPYSVDDSRVLRWSLDTWHALKEIAETAPQSGVQMLTGTEPFRTTTKPPPWIVRLDDFRFATPAELPKHFAVGWYYRAPVVEMESISAI